MKIYSGNKIYEQIKLAMQGYNVTVFAYGQTSSGKTFTMKGTKDQSGLIGKKSLIFIISKYFKFVSSNFRYHLVLLIKSNIIFSTHD